MGFLLFIYLMHPKLALATLHLSGDIFRLFIVNEQQG